MLRIAPGLPWRVLSNLSKLSLSLNFRTGSDFSHLHGPATPHFTGEERKVQRDFSRVI